MKVCVHCFNDLELKQFITSNSKEKGNCDYCTTKINSELLDINELLDFFASFLGIFINNTKGMPIVQLIQNDWNLFSSDLVCNNILSDILLILKSTLTSPQISVSYLNEIMECTSYWETLKEDIKWKNRYLTKLDTLDDFGWNRFFKHTIKISKKEKYYRARLHYSGDQKIFKKFDMGCPIQTKTLAGRANPLGIPYLYLSKEIKTTLYEIRATFLDEVSIGKFKVKKNQEVILVDFTEPASAFLHIDEIIEYTKSMLLKKIISLDLSKPMRRYDSELEYIPTQFICEYIKHFSDNADGILFNSSLHFGGKNIVLFDQSKVECISVSLYKVTKVEIDSEKM
jgi:hypothetical protein